MDRHLERLQQKHSRLNRLIDNCSDAVWQHEMKALKRLRLKLKDRIAQLQLQLQLQRSPGSIAR